MTKRLCDFLARRKIVIRPAFGTLAYNRGDQSNRETYVTFLSSRSFFFSQSVYIANEYSHFSSFVHVLRFALLNSDSLVFSTFTVDESRKARTFVSNDIFLSCRAVSRNVRMPEFLQRSILVSKARVFSTIRSLPKSWAFGCQHALIREINEQAGATPPCVSLEKLVRSVRMCSIVSLAAVVSAVYQIAAVNPVMGGRVRRRKTTIRDHGGKSGTLQG